MKSSPTCSVPFCTRIVASGPLPGSSVASSTVPWAWRAGFAFKSSSSACSRIWSSSSWTFWPVLAEIGVASVVPPNSSSTTPCVSRSCLTFCTLAAGRSILLIATTRGTPAFLACEIASIVCGMIASSAATTKTTMSVTCAPRARMDVKASWPGVSRNVVDVAHDRDHRRARLEIAHLLLGRFFGRGEGILLFPLRLEAEGGGDQLDHVEVEALVDRHHLPQLLEGEADDLLGGHLQDVRELGHRDELGHAHQRLLALLFVAPLLLLDFAEARPLLAPVRSLLRHRPLDRRQRAGDVLGHRFLIHQRLLALFALLALLAPPLLLWNRARRGRRDGSGRRRHGAAGRGTRHRLGPHGRRDQWPRRGGREGGRGERCGDVGRGGR